MASPPCLLVLSLSRGGDALECVAHCVSPGCVRFPLPLSSRFARALSSRFSFLVFRLVLSRLSPSPVSSRLSPSPVSPSLFTAPVTATPLWRASSRCVPAAAEMCLRRSRLHSGRCWLISRRSSRRRSSPRPSQTHTHPPALSLLPPLHRTAVRSRMTPLVASETVAQLAIDFRPS
jgi:hypothetical protein